jgi:hypothetical protein
MTAPPSANVTHWQLREARKEGVTQCAARQRKTERIVHSNNVGDEAEAAVALEQPEGRIGKRAVGVHPCT